jgi:hypothetical protein
MQILAATLVHRVPTGNARKPWHNQPLYPPPAPSLSYRFRPWRSRHCNPSVKHVQPPPSLWLLDLVKQQRAQWDVPTLMVRGGNGYFVPFSADGGVKLAKDLGDCEGQ